MNFVAFLDPRQHIPSSGNPDTPLTSVLLFPGPCQPVMACRWHTSGRRAPRAQPEELLITAIMPLPIHAPPACSGITAHMLPLLSLNEAGKRTEQPLFQQTISLLPQSSRPQYLQGKVKTDGKNKVRVGRRKQVTVAKCYCFRLSALHVAPQKCQNA